MSQKARDDETSRAISQIEQEIEIINFGANRRIRTGLLHVDFSKECYKSLRSKISELAPHNIFSHAFEGGQQDHDATAVIISKICQELNLKNYQIPMYRGRNEKNRLFSVQKFEKSSNTPLVHKTGRKFCWIALKMMYSYKSQRSTWFVLGFPVLFHFLIGKFYYKLDEQIHLDNQKIPYYEIRKKCTSNEIRNFYRSIFDN